MHLIALIFAPLIATLFGWFITRLLRFNLPFGERLALSYIFGLAAITLLMFYLNVLGIPFSLTSALFVPILAIIYLFVKERRTLVIFLSQPIKKLAKIKVILLRSWQNLPLLEKLIFALISFLVLTALARALYWPVFYWDAICAYDARAKFFIQDGLMTTVAQKVSWEFHNYPPFTSLAHTFFYLLGARNPKVLYTLIYITLLATMYSSLKAYVSRILALSLTLLLAANPFTLEHAAASYTNLAYTLFLGMGTVYLVRFLDKKNLSLFWSGVILFSLGAWTRPSPEWYFFAAFAIFVFCLLKEKIPLRLALVFALVFLVIWLPWPLFIRFIIGQKTLRVAQGTGVLVKNVFIGTLKGEMVWQKFWQMLKLLLGVTARSLNYILWLFLVVFFLNLSQLKTKRVTVYLFLFIAAYAFVVFIGVYLSLFAWKDWQNLIVNAANRFVMVFMPLLIFYVGLVVEGKRR